MSSSQDDGTDNSVNETVSASSTSTAEPVMSQPITDASASQDTATTSQTDDTSSSSESQIVQATVDDLQTNATIYIRRRKATITQLDYPLVFWQYDDEVPGEGSDEKKTYHRSYETYPQVFTVSLEDRQRREAEQSTRRYRSDDDEDVDEDEEVDWFGVTARTSAALMVTMGPTRTSPSRRGRPGESPNLGSDSDEEGGGEELRRHIDSHSPPGRAVNEDDDWANFAEEESSQSIGQTQKAEDDDDIFDSLTSSSATDINTSTSTSTSGTSNVDNGLSTVDPSHAPSDTSDLRSDSSPSLPSNTTTTTPTTTGSTVVSSTSNPSSNGDEDLSFDATFD